jgi:penicillin-binding protein 1A
MASAGGHYVKRPESVLHVGDVILARFKGENQFDLGQQPEIQSALMAMDPHSGYIKAMVGGYDFASSEFNRATQALRQPGSSFKPFVYSAGLDKGYTMDTIVVDGPVVFNLGGGQTWSPKNYGGNHNGAMRYADCIRFSRNIPTAKIVYDIGTHYLTAYQRKMGMTSPIGKYLSMALGANGVYLSEMVQAYAIFDNGGLFAPAIAITKIVDGTGRVIEEAAFPSAAPLQEELPTPEKAQEQGIVIADNKVDARDIRTEELNLKLYEQGKKAIEADKLSLTDAEIKTLYGSSVAPGYAITPQTAYLMVKMLKGVVDSGTGTVVKAIGKPAAGKTGTTNDETDTWFVGFVPDLVAGVWVGFDEIRQIAHGATGGHVAAPIFTDFMKQVTADWEAKDFQPPEDFPVAKMSSLTGGSFVEGSRAKPEGAGGGIVSGPRGGSDRAGEFFEQDYESGGID